MKAAVYTRRGPADFVEPRTEKPSASFEKLAFNTSHFGAPAGVSHERRPERLHSLRLACQWELLTHAYAPKQETR